MRLALTNLKTNQNRLLMKKLKKKPLAFTTQHWEKGIGTIHLFHKAQAYDYK
jgi:hypothetical protein